MLVNKGSELSALSALFQQHRNEQPWAIIYIFSILDEEARIEKVANSAVVTQLSGN